MDTPKDPSPKRGLYDDLPQCPPPVPPLAPNRWPATCNSGYAFVFYCVCGIVVGAAVGVLLVPMEGAFRWLHGDSFLIVGPTFAGEPSISRLFDHVAALMFLGSLVGLGGGAMLWLVGTCWSALRHPVCSASLCASLCASVALLFLLGGIPDSHALMRFITLVAMSMVVCAVFGYLHALAVRRVILWFEWWLNRTA